MTIRGLKMAAITVFFIFLLLCFTPIGENDHSVTRNVSFPALSDPSPLNYSTSPVNISVGSDPFGMSVDTKNGNVYVSNTNSSNVSVISVNNVVVNTIPVLGNPYGTQIPSQIIYDSYNSCVYVMNYFSPNLTVINTTTQSLSYIGAPHRVVSMAYDSRNNDVYVFDAYVGPSVEGISVISPSNRIIENLTVPRYGGLIPDAISPVYNPNDNSFFFLASSEFENVVADFNLNSMNISIVNNTKQYDNYLSIVFDPFNNCIYVTNLDSNITVINSSTNTVTQYSIAGLLPGIAYDSTLHDIVVQGYSNESTAIFYFLDARNSLTFTVYTYFNNFYDVFAYNPVDNSLYASVDYGNQVTVFPLSPPSVDSNAGMFLVYGVISVAVATASVLTLVWWKKSRT